MQELFYLHDVDMKLVMRLATIKLHGTKKVHFIKLTKVEASKKGGLYLHMWLSAIVRFYYSDTYRNECHKN